MVHVRETLLRRQVQTRQKRQLFKAAHPASVTKGRSIAMIDYKSTIFFTVREL
jgi:hypothetical protein